MNLNTAVTMGEANTYLQVDTNESNSLDVADLKCDGIHNMSLQAAEGYRYSRGETFLLTVLLPFILLFGVIGNGLFIYVAIRIPHMRTVTNRYLVSLSVADIMFLLAAIVHKLWKFAVTPVRGDDSPIGHVGCVWIYFLADMAYFASLMFVTLVSIDRYVAVCRPQERHSLIKGKSYEIVAVCWIFSAILAASLTPGNLNLVEYCLNWPDEKPYSSWPDTIQFCLPLDKYHWISSFCTGLQTIPFFITLVLNIYFYVAIIRGLDQCIRRMSQHGVQKNADTGMRNQIAKMLVVNGVVFFCFLFPFEIYSLFGMVAISRPTKDGSPTYLVKSEDVRSYILLLSQLLSYINSAVNPIIYTVMCRRYKQAFKEALLPASCMQHQDFDKGTISEQSCRTGRMELTTQDKKETNI